MQWKPNVTVAAIICQDDRFLLVEENDDGQIVLNQPAEHLEKNETLVDAIKREVMEETAWDFQPHSISGLYLHHHAVSDITYLRVCFIGSCQKYYPEQTLDERIIKTVWMAKKELESCKDKLRNRIVLQCVNDFLLGKQYPMEILNHYLKN